MVETMTRAGRLNSAIRDTSTSYPVAAVTRSQDNTGMAASLARSEEGESMAYAVPGAETVTSPAATTSPAIRVARRAGVRLRSMREVSRVDDNPPVRAHRYLRPGGHPT